MPNLRQDRVPEPALEHTPAPAAEASAGNGRAVALRGIALSIRLRMPDSSGFPAAVTWAADSPVAALAIDIVTASGGAPDPPQGAVLQSRFFNLQSALLAARRLQWAFEGLAQSSQAATSAAISIHSLEDPFAGSVAQMLERLAPGQVMLSATIAEPVQQLPGFALRPASDGNWRELQWQSQAGPSNLQADEQSVLGLIRGLGRQDPAPRVEAPSPAAPAPVTGASGAFQAPASLGRSFEPESAAPVWKKPWVLVSAGAALLVVTAAVIIPAMVSGGHSKAPVPDAPAQTAAPAASPAPPSSAAPSNVTSPAVPEKPRDQKPVAKPGRQPKAPANPGAVTEPPLPRPSPASCDLTAGEIPRSLSRAQSLMYAGKLEEAQDAYQHLLGCPSAREKALEGLRLVKQRMATQ